MIEAARHVTGILRTPIANATRENAATRARAVETRALLGEARGRLDAMISAQEGLGACSDAGLGRLRIMEERPAILRDRTAETRTHIDAMLDEKAALKAALLEVTDHSRVVADIARMARLLAIDAAVEAARAGDAGRGFAGVAREMQSFSEQSGRRAGMIDALVETFVGQLNGMRGPVRATAPHLDGVSEATATLLATLATAREGGAAARGLVGEARTAMGQETKALDVLLSRLGSVEVETAAALAGSAENMALGHGALMLLEGRMRRGRIRCGGRPDGNGGNGRRGWRRVGAATGAGRAAGFRLTGSPTRHPIGDRRHASRGGPEIRAATLARRPGPSRRPARESPTRCGHP